MRMLRIFDPDCVMGYGMRDTTSALDHGDWDISG